MNTFFLLLSLGTPELLMIAIVGLLLFGRRLPEVGRSSGKSFLQFKSGMDDIKSEMHEAVRMSNKPSERGWDQERHDAPTGQERREDD